MIKDKEKLIMPITNCTAKVLAFIFVSACLLFSCIEEKTKQNNKMVFTSFPKEINISFENIYDFKEGIPGMLKVIDSTLIIFNGSSKGTHFLFNYSLNSGLLSKGYIRRGRGPGEAIGGSGIGIIGNFLWMYDVTLKKILTLNVENTLNENNSQYINEVPLDKTYYMISFLDSLHYCGVGLRNSLSKIQISNLYSSKIISEFGKFETKPDFVSANAFKDAHQAFVFTNPSADKIIMAYRYTDAIEIFDIKNNTNIHVQGPVDFNVEFTPRGDEMMENDKTRCAFINGSVTEKFIYLPYSGHLAYDQEAYNVKHIYVYDWDGVPVKKLILDKGIYSLAVSNDDKTIYAYNGKTGFLMSANIE